MSRQYLNKKINKEVNEFNENIEKIISASESSTIEVSTSDHEDNLAPVEPIESDVYERIDEENLDGDISDSSVEVLCSSVKC